MSSSQIILPTVGIYAASAFKILPAINRIVGSIQRFKFASPVIDQVYKDLKRDKITLNGEQEGICTEILQLKKKRKFYH